MGSWWGRLRSFLSSPQGRYFLAGALGTAFLFTAGPSLGKTLRPVLRQGVHGLIALSDQVQGFIARTQEGLKDIVAEAQYQYQQGRAQAAAPSPAPPAPDQAVTTGAVTARADGAAGSARVVGSAGAGLVAQADGVAGAGAVETQVPDQQLLAPPTTGPGDGAAAGPKGTSPGSLSATGKLSESVSDGVGRPNGKSQYGAARSTTAIPPTWMLPQRQEPGVEAQPSPEDEAGDPGE